ncbi:hypothetical protein LIER_35439 [Lithospermum erythrorhizon]|uniref:Uncharacterized protein n=1 Tax=Lithospermum erythrorhizon TaxID=34254 RepID=A0AAV3NUI8_LITER
MAPRGTSSAPLRVVWRRFTDGGRKGAAILSWRCGGKARKGGAIHFKWNQLLKLVLQHLQKLKILVGIIAVLILKVKMPLSVIFCNKVSNGGIIRHKHHLLGDNKMSLLS